MPYNGFPQPPEGEDEEKEGQRAEEQVFYEAQAEELARRKRAPEPPQPAHAVHLGQIHTHDLPCPGCEWGWRSDVLGVEDFCETCGHFHVESECPIEPYGKVGV